MQLCWDEKQFGNTAITEQPQLPLKFNFMENVTHTKEFLVSTDCFIDTWILRHFDQLVY